MKRAMLGRFLEEHTSPASLFLAGAVILPAFLFQNDLAVRIAQVTIFAGFAWASGRGVRPLPTLVAIFGIVAFNLLVPAGRVILSVAGFPLTEAALKNGIARATTVAGMIAISRLTIRGGLRFPGPLGELVGRSLIYFERILAGRFALDRKNVIGSIDSFLLRIHRGEKPRPPSTRPRTTAAGCVFLAVLVAANWGLLAGSLARPGMLWGR